MTVPFFFTRSQAIPISIALRGSSFCQRLERYLLVSNERDLFLSPWEVPLPTNTVRDAFCYHSALPLSITWQYLFLSRSFYQDKSQSPWEVPLSANALRGSSSCQHLENSLRVREKRPVKWDLFLSPWATPLSITLSDTSFYHLERHLFLSPWATPLLVLPLSVVPLSVVPLSIALSDTSFYLPLERYFFC